MSGSKRFRSVLKNRTSANFITRGASPSTSAPIITSLSSARRFEVLPTLVEHYGEPYADSSAVPTYYVAKKRASTSRLRSTVMVATSRLRVTNVTSRWD